jgi:hypothetical protein
MGTDAEVVESIDVLFAVEGQAEHLNHVVDGKVRVREFVEIARSASQITELAEVYVEDADAPLGGDLVLIEYLSAEFKPLHVARPGKIKTKVRYQERHVEHDFRPAATMEKIIVWAISPHELDLKGDPSDFQLKQHGKVLGPGVHLGQVADGKKEVTLDMVFKVKPQG